MHMEPLPRYVRDPPDSVRCPSADELGKWSGPKNWHKAKIGSNSPGSADYLVRKRPPVRIRAWAPRHNCLLCGAPIGPVISSRCPRMCDACDLKISSIVCR